MKPSREIRQLRRAAGITAQQLDKLCFFSEGLIEKIETNKVIPTENMIKEIKDKIGKIKQSLSSKFWGRKITEQDVIEIRRLYYEKLMTLKDISEKFNISKKYASELARKERVKQEIIEEQPKKIESCTVKKERASSTVKLYDQSAIDAHLSEHDVGLIMELLGDGMRPKEIASKFECPTKIILMILEVMP